MRFACGAGLAAGVVMAAALFAYRALYRGLVRTDASSGQTVTEAAGAADETENRDVFSRIGTAGEETLLLQERLCELGYLTGPASGIYDEATADAVRRYQREHDLPENGVAGPKTLLSLGIAEQTDLCSFGKTALLARIVWAEAGEYGYLTQLAVAQTLLNRLESASFGDTLTEVSYADWAWDAEKRARFAEEPPDVALRAAEDALNGMSPVTDALYWYNADTCRDDFLSGRELCAEIGSIRFVR